MFISALCPLFSFVDPSHPSASLIPSLPAGSPASDYHLLFVISSRTLSHPSHLPSRDQLCAGSSGRRRPSIAGNLAADVESQSTPHLDDSRSRPSVQRASMETLSLARSLAARRRLNRRLPRPGSSGGIRPRGLAFALRSRLVLLIRMGQSGCDVHVRLSLIRRLTRAVDQAGVLGCLVLRRRTYHLPATALLLLASIWSTVWPFRVLPAVLCVFAGSRARSPPRWHEPQHARPLPVDLEEKVPLVSGNVGGSDSSSVFVALLVQWASIFLERCTMSRRVASS